jgi:hypothetical protein
VLACVKTGQIKCFGGKWNSMESSRSINELQTMAVERAYEHYGHLFEGAQVHLYLDNEAARIGLTKGRSKSYMLNHKVFRSLPLIRRVTSSIFRVCSACNCSDEPSRQLEIDLNKTRVWVTTALAGMPTASPIFGCFVAFAQDVAPTSVGHATRTKISVGGGKAPPRNVFVQPRR